MKKIEIISNKNISLVALLCENQIGYATIQKLLRKKDVLIDGKRTSKDVVLQKGSVVCVFLQEDQIVKKFELFYEDNNILVVFKKRGIESCDGQNCVYEQLKQTNKNLLALHRLDANTEGLLVFAKTEQVFECYKNASRKGQITKNYFAQIACDVTKKSGVYYAYLKKDASKSFVSVFDKSVQQCQQICTAFEIFKDGKYPILDVQIKNGKTHQIRAHLAYLKMPILGDSKYGNFEENKKAKVQKQQLFAYKLSFNFDENCLLAYLNKKPLCIDFDKFRFVN